MDAGFNSERIRGSGKVVQGKRDVSGFHEVDFAGSGELSIQQGRQEALTVEADDNLLPYIRTEVEGGKLTIGFRRGVSVSASSPLRFTLSVRDLDALEISGSGKTHTGPLHSSDFRLHVSGSGEMRIGSLDADTLDASISGSGSIELPGKIGRQQIHISGSGSFDGADLQSQSADISISGSGNATLYARENLTAHISGSGSVSYYGNPAIMKKVSGSGSIRQLSW
jgi:hypothetical protein